jgi:hypothetical protein
LATAAFEGLELAEALAEELALVEALEEVEDDEVTATLVAAEALEDVDARDVEALVLALVVEDAVVPVINWIMCVIESDAYMMMMWKCFR